ncbi:MAG: ABC transporter permease [Deltaproteobacteria bacterium]|nr:ABC transporter permease [Deltaproteobacteria bacterium]
MSLRILRRLAGMGVVIVLVSGITFGLMHLAPGDPALQVAMARYGMDAVSPEQVEFVRSEERLDRPFWTQYVRWLWHIIRLDLGRSLVSGEPVAHDIKRSIKASLLLAVAGLAFSLILTIPVGVWAGMQKDSAVDIGSSLIALVMASSPTFFTGLLLLLVVSIRLDILPVAGHGNWKHLILPALTVGISLTAVSMRLMRTSVLEVLESPHILFARAKGLNTWQVVRGHVIKNAFLPVITYIGLQLGALMDGVVIVETIFAWPGVGRLLIEAIMARDFPTIQGAVLCIAAAYVAVNFIVDLSYMLLNPRIRLESVQP